MSLDPALVQTLEVLRASIEANGYAPSLTELAESLGMKSKAGVHHRLAALEDAGLIERMGPRAVRIVSEVSE